MAVVGLHRRETEPGTQLIQGREVVLDVPERNRSLAPRQILQQFGRPDVRLARAVSHDAGNNGVVLEEIIGAGRELDQAVGHSGFLSEIRWRSTHSYEEAAQVCGVAVGTIKSRVNRARSRLAQTLAVKHGEEFNPDPTIKAALQGTRGT